VWGPKPGTQLEECREKSVSATLARKDGVSKDPFCARKNPFPRSDGRRGKMTESAKKVLSVEEGAGPKVEVGVKKLLPTAGRYIRRGKTNEREVKKGQRRVVVKLH